MSGSAPKNAWFVYGPEYRCDIGAHVFRTEKYGLLHRRIIESGLAGPDQFLEPSPATREDLLLVHTPEYVDDLLSARRTRRTISSEMPVSREIVEAFTLGAGGTIVACRTAVERGAFTMNLAGGFHHAFPDWAEGFCYINDVALGVARLRSDGLVRRAMVVDCDLHQGNGTAVIFQDEPDVFTLSIHEEDIYPIKRRSDLDIGLRHLCTGEEYLSLLEENLLPAMDRHGPEFVLYVAGADPYKLDLLGSLQLDLDDIRRRDEIVLGACAQRGIPVATVLAGGYCPRVEDTVNVHFTTAQTLCALAPALGARP